MAAALATEPCDLHPTLRLLVLGTCLSVWVPGNRAVSVYIHVLGTAAALRAVLTLSPRPLPFPAAALRAVLSLFPAQCIAILLPPLPLSLTSCCEQGELQGGVLQRRVQRGCLLLACGTQSRRGEGRAG